MPPASSPVTIRGYELGPFATNTYTVELAGYQGIWIVDPSFDVGEVINAVKRSGKTPELILLTHAHIDHIAGINDVLDAFGNLPIAIHRDEAHWLQDPRANLSAISGRATTARKAPDQLLAEGDTLTLGPAESGATFKVLHTPGHSPGSASFYLASTLHLPLIAPLLISGDVLFAGSIGRTDFPGGGMPMLAHSIRTKLYTLPDSTRVFPGHGPPTSIGREKSGNPYVSGEVSR